MDVWVAAILAMIVASTLYSYYRQVSFSIVAVFVCVVSFALLLLSEGTTSDTMHELAFMPEDLLDPGRLYTLLTSMYTHASFGHLLLNMLGIAFLGSAFEQRIGTRPFILLYFVSGICGTLAFALLNWGDSHVAVVGASGAIFGILAAFVRLFPHERMTLLLGGLFPLPAMPLWVIAAGFIALQFLFLYGDTNVAVEAHIGGLVAGALFVPLVARLPLHRRVKKMVSKATLRRLATTPELKSMMRKIDDEEIADVRSAWIEEFLSRAECPQCGARLRARKDGVECDRGHKL